MLPPRPVTAAARPVSAPLADPTSFVAYRGLVQPVAAQKLHALTLCFVSRYSLGFYVLSSNSRQLITQMPGLLSIPSELRLHIYDVILDADLDCQILERWSAGDRDQGFSSKPKTHEQTKLNVTWCNLLLACKTIYAELNSHMSKTRTGAYIAEIERCRHSLGAFRWRKLDCSPRHIENMLVIFKSEPNRKWYRFQGCGGPLPIVRELFQSRNVLLHCGPRMDVTKPLPELMHIGKLKIVLSFPASKRGPPDWDSSSVRDYRIANFEEICAIASTVCAQGIVYGHVDKMEVAMGEKTWEMEVQDRGQWLMPESWHGYGFEWGLDQFRQTCTQSDSGDSSNMSHCNQ